MQRASYEKVVFQVNGNVVTFIASTWQESRQGQEVFAEDEQARERYEQVKMIAAIDYGFHLFMENVDEEG